MFLPHDSRARVAAGIIYATGLALKGYNPMLITMSLGGTDPTAIIQTAIDYDRFSKKAHGIIRARDFRAIMIHPL